MTKNGDAEISVIAQKLRDVEQEFEQQMRARGFDPQQFENLALTSPLAKLFQQREELTAQLDALKQQED